MADKEEGEGTTPKGADWEVVSLTASTYAAAPSPKDDQKSEVIDTDKSETSNTLFMSGHFVFPPNQHENLPLERENTEIGDDMSESIKEEGEKSSAKEEDNWNINKLTESNDFHGIPFLDKKRSDFEDTGLDLTGKDESIYNSATFHYSEPNIDDEDRVILESVDSSSSSDVLNVSKNMEDDDYDDGSGIPYASWWKKHAASLYSHAKEANTFWSIFIAAAVMGLVIIGQQWQQERWQYLHHKWHSGVYDEKFGRMLGPISRIKEAVVGGNRRGFSIRGSSTTRNH